MRSGEKIFSASGKPREIKIFSAYRSVQLNFLADAQDAIKWPGSA
jgi:hypothetical protein